MKQFPEPDKIDCLSKTSPITKITFYAYVESDDNCGRIPEKIEFIQSSDEIGSQIKMKFRNTLITLLSESLIKMLEIFIDTHSKEQ